MKLLSDMTRCLGYNCLNRDNCERYLQRQDGLVSIGAPVASHFCGDEYSMVSLKIPVAARLCDEEYSAIIKRDRVKETKRI